MKRNWGEPMVSRSLIVVYILIILLFSGFVKADTVETAEIQITNFSNIKYSEENHLLLISGFLPNVCVENVSPSISLNDISGNLVLDIIARRPVGADNCVQISGYFDLVFDIRSIIPQHLKALSGNENLLTINGTDELIPLEGLASNEYISAGSDNLSGRVVALEDGSFGVISDDGELFVLKVPIKNGFKINLNKYVDAAVVLFGQKNSVTNPGLDLTSNIYPTRRDANSFVLFGISSL